MKQIDKVFQVNGCSVEEQTRKLKTSALQNHTGIFLRYYLIFIDKLTHLSIYWMSSALKWFKAIWEKEALQNLEGIETSIWASRWWSEGCKGKSHLS